MIRAFVGVRIDPAVAGKLARIQAELRPKLAGIRWAARENLHFTLKFLGPVEEEQVPRIARALEGALRKFRSFSIFSRGLGVFPDIRRARVLWAGLDGKDLSALAETVERALAPLGFAAEARPFRAHLTLGRWREFTGRAELLGRELERFKDVDFGSTRVGEVVLFQSTLGPQGSRYTPLQVIPLERRQSGSASGPGEEE